MSDQKTHQFRPVFVGGTRNTRAAASRVPHPPATTDGSDHRISEQQGWDAYRKWLSRVNIAPAQRSSIDTSIYSWRGYNNWAEKVRQNWENDEIVDS